MDRPNISINGIVRPMNDDEYAAWLAEEPEGTAETAKVVRAERNALLAKSDWTQLADSPLDADAKLAWQLYRETLRMVPQQPGFPYEIQWPPEPGTN